MCRIPFPRFPYDESTMNQVRNVIIGCTVAALMAVVSTPASAGLRHCKKKAADCCEPAPCPAPVVCAEPAPAPVVCVEPAPVVCAPVCPAPAPVCPPPPVEVTWCVVDPCTGCQYEVSACVPACCAGVTPCLAGCKDGLLGRKILTYKFECCNHCVDVVVTKHGRTIVRG
jgi:hypothetical protein